MNFNCFLEVCEFANLLDRLAAVNHFNVRRRTCGEGSTACCIITKNRWHFETSKRLVALSKKKSNELVQLRGKIESDSPSNSSVQMSIAGAASFDVQVVVPPNKHVKLEAPVAYLRD